MENQLLILMKKVFIILEIERLQDFKKIEVDRSTLICFACKTFY